VSVLCRQLAAGQLLGSCWAGAGLAAYQTQANPPAACLLCLLVCVALPHLVSGRCLPCPLAYTSVPVPLPDRTVACLPVPCLATLSRLQWQRRRSKHCSYL
jgi:hypothetical protein